VDAHFGYWPAATGHEMVADREPVLQALFGPGFREVTAAAVYERFVESGGGSVDFSGIIRFLRGS